MNLGFLESLDVRAGALRNQEPHDNQQEITYS